MDWKLELVAVPVSDVDRAKDFYAEKAGFNVDHDHTVSDEIRFVQLTPPGSACSIALGKGISEVAPGTAQGLQMVVDDIEAARAELIEPRRRDRRDPGLPVGPVRVLQRPGRQRLGGSAVTHSRLTRPLESRRTPAFRRPTPTDQPASTLAGGQRHRCRCPPDVGE